MALAKYVTREEFEDIKVLLKNHSKKEVAQLAKRSKMTITAIAKFDTFKEFKDYALEVSKKRVEKQKKAKTPDTKGTITREPIQMQLQMEAVKNEVDETLLIKFARSLDAIVTCLSEEQKQNKTTTNEIISILKEIDYRLERIEKAIQLSNQPKKGWFK